LGGGFLILALFEDLGFTFNDITVGLDNLFLGFTTTGPGATAAFERNIFG
jgi:hypothetical protein